MNKCTCMVGDRNPIGAIRIDEGFGTLKMTVILGDVCICNMNRKTKKNNKRRK